MPGILCEHCTALCCRYIALPLDEPESRRDYDDIRWYLLHEGVSVFVEDGDWYICVQTVCRHLQPDHRCGIYETRPRICREYSTDNCDYHSGDYGWEQHFTCPEHLDEYVRANSRPRQRSGRAGRNGSRRSRRVRGGVRAHLRPYGRNHRRRRDAAYAAMTTDTRGTPLPVLRIDP
jgi:Fe-S-cluster containining protein